MNSSKFIYAFAAAAALTCSSCSGFLDTPTDTRVDLVNTDQVRMLMNSAYPSSNYSWPCELMSDNMEDNNSPEGVGNLGIHYNLNSYDRGDEEMFRWETCVSNTGSDSPSAIWEGFYNSTAVANAAMERLDQWREENGGLDKTQEAIYAEAQMLRAYNHFTLAQIFCEPYRGSLSRNYLGIPYITRPEVTVKPHYERGTLEETYKRIQDDIEAALPKIDNTIYEVPKYHFNAAAANAFAARFYLFTRQYKKALDCANAAFGGENVDPTPFLSTVWSKLGEMTYISDMGLYQDNIDKAGNFLLYPTYSGLLRRLGSGCRYAVIRDALDATIHGASPVWSTFRWTSKRGKDKKTFTMHPCFNGICISNGEAEYGTAMCGNVAEQFEYTDKISGIGYAHVTRREFYGEETLLVRAEARLFLGDVAGAIKDLDTWERPRRNCPGAAGYEKEFVDFSLENITAFYGDNDPGYGIAKPIHIDRICPLDNNPLNPKANEGVVAAESVMPVLQCIQHMRRIETVHKGLRWFDIKRFGIEFDRKIGNNQAPDYHTMDHLGIEDPRKAMALPAEVVAAGLQPNPRPAATTLTPASELVRVN